MRSFIKILFGGLAILFACLAAISMLRTIGDSMSRQKQDGTATSGFRRVVTYSAFEEEDSASAAAESLPGAPEKPITAKAYILENLKNGDVVAAYSADRVMPIASLAKLVAAIVADRHIEPSARVAITDDVMNTYGNTAGFKSGEIFQAGDLLYPLLMVSSNDAAEALARVYGRRGFIQAMNDFTQSIGAYRTYFDDPSGLSPNDVSTPRDLAIIMDWIRENDPNILNITLIKEKNTRSHTWVNPTHFLSLSNYLGGKNGYIPESNRTGASLFALGKNREPYAAIVLGSSSRDGDVFGLLKKVAK